MSCMIHYASCIMHHASNTKTDNNTDTDTDTDILIPILIWWNTRKMTYDGRRFMMDDDLWWNTTYDGRQLMMEDDLWWKTTYDGRRLMMEDTLWWKMTYDERQQWGWPQKQRGLVHWQKAHCAGHIPLCGIFYHRLFVPVDKILIKVNSIHHL